jgi:stage II sporulation protein P
MNYNMMNFKAQISYKVVVIFAMLLCFLFAAVPIVAKASSSLSQGNRNLVFVQLINYTIPTVKVTSFNEDDLAENSFNFNNILKNFVGIDFSSPSSVMSREIPSLRLSNGAINNANTSFSLNPFVLNDQEISKVQLDNQNSSLNNTNVNIYNAKLKKTLNTAKPEVLIYHTHTTESYKPGGPNSFDDTQNVVSVGDALVNELQNGYGISAINDRTVHDATAYTQSYSRSRVTLANYLKKYGNFKIIIDLHRDSVEDKNAETIKMNGENVAKFMMVMAKKNPHFAQNMKIANFLVTESNKLFPGFCKGIDTGYNYGTGFFNQDMSNNAILVEVGADINTTTEADASAKYIARLIAEYLNGNN